MFSTSNSNCGIKTFKHPIKDHSLEMSISTYQKHHQNENPLGKQGQLEKNMEHTNIKRADI